MQAPVIAQLPSLCAAMNLIKFDRHLAYWNKSTMFSNFSGHPYLYRGLWKRLPLSITKVLFNTAKLTSQTESQTDFLEDFLQADSLTNEQGIFFSSSKGFPSVESYKIHKWLKNTWCIIV